MDDHIVPLVVTIVVWFFATGLIAWLDNRDRSTFARSLVIGGIAGLVGLCMILVSMHSVSNIAIYASFGGALLVWAWQEIGFLTGAITGPRREPCPPGAWGWDRFAHATASMIYHEIALALTGLIVVALSWNAPNQTGALCFALLYAMRLSAKLNIFFGVPNAASEIMPPHLAYLRTYYGPERLNAALVLSLALAVALAAWIASLALASTPGSPQAVQTSLLFALAALGVLEHVFLALPFRDGILWGWALPSRRNRESRRTTPFDLTGEADHGL